MFGLKMGELLIIFLVILVLFGGTKLPQLGSSLGQAIRNFKKGFGGEAQEAQGEAQRQDSLSTGNPDSGKTGTRTPASAGKDA
jgi:sec-independent protein translocase protein TatA